MQYTNISFIAAPLQARITQFNTFAIQCSYNLIETRFYVYMVINLL